MWTALSSQLEALSVGTTDLVIALILGAGALTILSVAFGTFALCSHVWSQYRDQIWEERKQNWRTQLLEVLAQERPPESLTEEVPMRHYASFLEVLIPFATLIEGREERLIHALAAPFMPKLKESLSSRRPLVRAQAVQRVGLLGGSKQADALRQMLDDPSDRVVEMAFRRLAKHGNANDTQQLLACLTRLNHLDRRQISSALVELGEDAAPILRAAMANPARTSYVRVCCAESLRWLGDSVAASEAARLLRETDRQPTDDTPELTASLLRLLRRVGKEAHAPLARSFCHAPEAFVRLHAARALGQLGTPEDKILLGALVYGDDSRWVALSAAQSLIELGVDTPLRKLRTLDHPRAQLASDFLLDPDT